MFPYPWKSRFLTALISDDETRVRKLVILETFFLIAHFLSILNRPELPALGRAAAVES